MKYDSMPIRKQSFLIILLFLLPTMHIQAQGKVKGRVVDAHAGSAVEYATVTLLNPTDSSIVTGCMTDASGKFACTVIYGKYLLRISFIGYATFYYPNSVTVSSKHTVTDVGKVTLTPTDMVMDEVVVKAERSMMEYKLDKRVVNVDKNIVTSGGTATDVLENIPSVTIGNDGNVTLRGSANVKVLIDGRPYELMGSDLESLLEQIPATTVENVEIITNPSAKYDPEGMSGIININLKEKSATGLGLNGVVNLNVGAPLPFMIPDALPKFIPTAMGSASLNYTTEKYSLFFNADGGIRSRGNSSTTYIERKNAGIPYAIDSMTTASMGSNTMGSVKIGGEYYFNKKNTLLLSYQYRSANRMGLSITDDKDLFGKGYLDYLQYDTSNHNQNNHTINLLYTRKFDKPEQLLTLNVTQNFRIGHGTGSQEQQYVGESIWTNNLLRTSDSRRNNRNTNIKLDYTHPFNFGWKLETGYEGQIQSSGQNLVYYVTSYDDSHQLVRRLDEQSSSYFLTGQNIHAVYATFGGKIVEHFSAQAGLRGEYSNINGHDEKHPDATPANKTYWQLYPTLHLSYEINKTNSIQLSYSRRVRRPNPWSLNPYIDVEEGQQMSFGNIGLAPEFTNSVELSYSVSFEKVNLYTSAYFRQTDSMMTRYGFVWNQSSVVYYAPWMTYTPEYDGYWASTWQNLSKGINAGLEIIVDWQVLKWWKLNVSVNLFDSYIQGTALLGNSDRNAFRMSGKINNYMTLPKDWTVQFSGQYQAPFMDLQTDMRAVYWFDLAVKKDVLEKRGTINIRVGDIFCTGGFGHTTDNESLYRVMRMRRISPTITIGFSYKINNGLKTKARIGADEEESADGDY